MTSLAERRRDAGYEAADEWRHENREVCGWCDGVSYPEWDTAEIAADDYARHEPCRKAIADRTCDNKECPEYGMCFVDYQRGDPCEFCGKGLGL